MNTPMFRVMRRTVAASGIGLALAACGGGGGESTTSATCEVTSLSVTPSSASVAVGAKTQLGASFSSLHCNGSPALTWTSSAQTIATVSSTGEVTGVAAGSAVITATAGGMSGSAAVTVNGAPTLSVSSVIPAAGATEVTIDSTVRLVFSATIDPTTVTSSTVFVTLGTTAVAGTLTVSGNTVTFKPAVPLTEFRTGYALTATTGVQSSAGNFLASPFTSSFTTAFGDPNYYYQITNEFIGPTKALDTFGGPPYDAFLSSPLATFSGQYWYFVAFVGGDGVAYSYLKNSFRGDGQALEGASTGGLALMTDLAPPPNHFSGQAWTFTLVGAPYPNGYRLQNQNIPTSSLDVPLADASQVGLRATGTFTGQVWYFKRMNHR
jgi:hypothetical protein